MVKSLLKILYTLLESPLSLRLFHVPVIARLFQVPVIARLFHVPVIARLFHIPVIARLFHVPVIANAIIAIPFNAEDCNLVLMLLIVNSRIGTYPFHFMKFLAIRTKKYMSAILLANGNQ